MYTWDDKVGVRDGEGNQAIQLVGGTKKFRRQCGRLLVGALNAQFARQLFELSPQTFTNAIANDGVSPKTRGVRNG